MNRSAWAVVVLIAAPTFIVGCGESPDEGQAETVDTTVCASGKRWIGGNEESELMRPGEDCIACHAQEREAPKYTLAGTVFSQSHEADDCFGVAGVTVQVTDANNNVTTLTSNAAGNFFTQNPIATPYTIQVKANGRTNPMATPQTTGGCNSCHTQQGANSAPGRVLSP